MRCPYCEHLEDKVIDSRLTEDGHSIRRRRECEACGRRFTTYERFEETMLMVVKKDRRREKFDRSKILNGFLRACQKRPVSYEQIERSVNKIEQTLRHRGDSEVSGQEIGELVMKTLRDLDEVAYVRFASVYKEFKDISNFAEELKVLEKLPRTIEDAPPGEEG